MTAYERKQIDNFLVKVRRAMIALLRGTGLTSEDKEAVAYAATEATERELTKIVKSFK